jgi:SAM-dependent methyltransferase
MTESVVPGPAASYYQGHYWNDLPAVQRQLNVRATGDPDLAWHDHLRDRWGPFDRALVINCGNGWVERTLIERGVISRAVGTDVSTDLLDQAAGAARDLGLDLDYHVLDTNSAAFPDGPFDLVVNHAALHHVAYLDRVVRALCRLLTPDGVFVTWDYVGPHRNQYEAAAWEAAWQVNERLPPVVRNDLRYPHLPTMLATDPTEAIHSELVLPTLRRYLRIEHERALGGAIAYPVLTHNERLHGSDDAATVDAAAEAVMAADAEYTDGHPETTLFAYVVGRPDPVVLDDADQLAAWSAEEDEREATAVRSGGRYHPPTALGALSESLADARDVVAATPDRPATASDPAAVAATIPGRVLAQALYERLLARLRSRIPRRR